MQKLTSTLEFACCSCPQTVRVTVQCSGPDLGRFGGTSLASVKIPCPTCGQVNQLVFEPCGQVRSVRPYTCFRVVPEPSLN